MAPQRIDTEAAFTRAVHRPADDRVHQLTGSALPSS